MRSFILQNLARIGAGPDRDTMSTLWQQVAAQSNTQALASAGLVISGAAATTTKVGATDFYATVKGSLVKVAAGTVLTALTGLTITATRFNVACFFVDVNGTVSVSFGTEGTTLVGLKFPDWPIDRACIGILLITHSATFTGGTTALDTATTVYLSPVGSFDPTFLFS